MPQFEVPKVDRQFFVRNFRHFCLRFSDSKNKLLTDENSDIQIIFREGEYFNR
ncbi:hypothetical protein AQPE_1090 [Aquipluma nitroreducens]|uniref:Uncharacterized protein n=1 Tax=Aquipluma nitroreducens TaxID=2010828 RepID=A0A5K7S5Y2_9BACT|nr:hypothetical protein AQPE_1090 [Aquipluma nitroreducens]